MWSDSEMSTPSQSKPTLVNWALAAKTAATLTPAGPKLSASAISSAVADLHAKAAASVEHVHRISELEAAADLRDSEVLVVDRPGWSKANTQSFAVMLDSTLRRAEASAAKGKGLSGAARDLSGTVTGVQLGGILAFLSSKVLGQYDPFAALAPDSDIPQAGRLLLVAPNILSVEKELNVDADDFRLWVCLHEQTHRVQFAAAPWLREHMLDEVDKLSATLFEGLLSEGSALADRLKSADGKGSSSKGLLDLIPDGEQKSAISRLTAVMSLLEGHANVVMDGVDASVVPSVRTIRQRFNSRGKDRGAVEKFIRNLLGLNAKMKQYSDGARFVRAVVDQAGLATFNQVWLAPENLPSEAEIHDPSQWVRRIEA